MSDYTPTTDEVRDVYGYAQTYRDFDRWYAEEIRKAELHGKRTGWSEGYEQGKEDERLAETLQVDVGLGGYAPANRSNPHTEES
jgi:predicted transposase YdaD